MSMPPLLVSKYIDGLSRHLEKKGHLVRSWKQRYFVLAPGECSLKYYGDTSLTQLKGEYIIDRNCTVAPFIGDGSSGKRKYTINFTAKKIGGSDSHELLAMATFNEEDLHIWTEALTDAIHDGFPFVKILELWESGFYPRIRMTMTYGDVKDSFQVKDDDLILANKLEKPPRITYGAVQAGINFTLMLVDPNFSKTEDCAAGACCVHWIVSNISGPDITSGAEVVKYVAPAPSFNTGVHACYLLLFRQSAPILLENLREISKITLANRLKFSVKLFAELCLLGNPIAISRVMCDWDESCDARHATLGYCPPVQCTSPLVLASHQHAVWQYLNVATRYEEVNKETGAEDFNPTISLIVEYQHTSNPIEVLETATAVSLPEADQSHVHSEHDDSSHAHEAHATHCCHPEPPVKFQRDFASTSPSLVAHKPMVRLCRHKAVVQREEQAKTGEETVETPTEATFQSLVVPDPAHDAHYCLVLSDVIAEQVDQASERRHYEYIHWVVVNIPQSCLSEGAADILSSGGGEELVSYVGAAPPHGSGVHKYMFCLYKQQPQARGDCRLSALQQQAAVAALSGRVICSSAQWARDHLGYHQLPVEATKLVNNVKRLGPGLGLGSATAVAVEQRQVMTAVVPVGVSAFEAEWDDSVDMLHQELKWLPPENHLSPRQLHALETAREATRLEQLHQQKQLTDAAASLVSIDAMQPEANHLIAAVPPPVPPATVATGGVSSVNATIACEELDETALEEVSLDEGSFNGGEIMLKKLSTEYSLKDRFVWLDPKSHAVIWSKNEQEKRLHKEFLLNSSCTVKISSSKTVIVTNDTGLCLELQLKTSDADRPSILAKEIQRVCASKTK